MEVDASADGARATDNVLDDPQDGPARQVHLMGQRGAVAHARVAAGDDDARRRDALGQFGEEELAEQLGRAVPLAHVPLGHFSFEGRQERSAGALVELRPAGRVGADQDDAAGGAAALLGGEDGSQQADEHHVGQIIDLHILLVAGLAVEGLGHFEDAGVKNGQVESVEGLGPVGKGDDGAVGGEIELPDLDGVGLEVPARDQVLARDFALGLAAHRQDDFTASEVEELAGTFEP